MPKQPTYKELASEIFLDISLHRNSSCDDIYNRLGLDSKLLVKRILYFLENEKGLIKGVDDLGTRKYSVSNLSMPLQQALKFLSED